MSTDTTIRIHGVATVSVPVADQERALAFYTGTLGLEVRRDAQYGPGLRWIEVAPKGSDSATIALPSLGPNTRPGVDTGIRLTTTDAAADHATLRDQGVDVDTDLLRVPNVPPMFSFRDPDGNTLYVVQSA